MLMNYEKAAQAGSEPCAGPSSYAQQADVMGEVELLSVLRNDANSAEQVITRGSSSSQALLDPNSTATFATAANRTRDLSM